jgi:hypothetical protein
MCIYDDGKFILCSARLFWTVMSINDCILFFTHASSHPLARLIDMIGMVLILFCVRVYDSFC